MLKKIIIYIFLTTTAGCLFGQNFRIIKFIDLSLMPLDNVSVFVSGELKCISNENGECVLDRNTSEIHCRYKNYYDTIVNITDSGNYLVKLSVDFIILDDVVVKANGNAKKELSRLLEKSQKTAYKLDTSIYYEFKEINIIRNTGQYEIFSGVLRLENGGYSKEITPIFIDSISLYYSSIDTDIYTLLYTSRIREKFILDPLTSFSINFTKKNYNIQRQGSYSDTTRFNLSLKNENIATEYSYITFVNDKIHTSEKANVRYSQVNNLSYYYNVIYSPEIVILPEYITSNRDYLISDSLILNNFVELKKIDKPLIGFEINKLLQNDNCKIIVEKIEALYPYIIIPKEKMEIEELLELP